jgi:single-strand DNA-binding protein
MNSINIAGNLIKDAELRATNSGDNVLTFSIADNQGANKDAIFWNCSLFGKRALSLQQYLSKGQSVTVTGSLAQRNYQDKTGQEKTAFDVRVNDLALQGGKRQEEAPQPKAKPKADFSDMDSDVPF